MIDLAAALGAVALKVSAAFGGPYHAAQIVSQADIASDPTYRDCMAQVDAATEAMRGGGDFTEADRRMLVLRAGLTGEITSDDRIRVLAGPFAGSLWKIVPPIASDSVAAYYELQARPCG